MILFSDVSNNVTNEDEPIPAVLTLDRRLTSYKPRHMHDTQHNTAQQAGAITPVAGTRGAARLNLCGSCFGRRSKPKGGDRSSTKLSNHKFLWRAENGDIIYFKLSFSSPPTLILSHVTQSPRSQHNYSVSRNTRTCHTRRGSLGPARRYPSLTPPPFSGRSESSCCTDCSRLWACPVFPPAAVRTALECGLVPSTAPPPAVRTALECGLVLSTPHPPAAVRTALDCCTDCSIVWACPVYPPPPAVRTALECGLVPSTPTCCTDCSRVWASPVYPPQLLYGLLYSLLYGLLYNVGLSHLPPAAVRTALECGLVPSTPPPAAVRTALYCGLVPSTPPPAAVRTALECGLVPSTPPHLLYGLLYNVGLSRRPPPDAVRTAL
ncbi:hypothetical protein RRG08_044231 [Elysia crispata]|uniref:Uncharacterized protein n=1 Tax=Elysia crispata TaxID=231223 RepID=A0AAE0XWM1_9GAST|nr:hypothetical protein RRG08_044231 [Elysia crispata]